MDILDEIIAAPAYAIVRFGASDQVTLLGGRREDLTRLADVPLHSGTPAPGRRFDSLLLVPFRQISERGFAAHDDGTPLSCLHVDTETEVSVDDLLQRLPADPIETDGRGGFDVDDDTYADTVGKIINDEIGRGEGANFVIARSFRAGLKNWTHRSALSVLRRLLEGERGAYWTYVIFTGDRWLIGASPERHVSVHGGDVRMNPISGTFRLRGLAEDPAGRKQALLDFLADEKEIYELFMVVDEELKIMCEVCSEGGQVLGPYLKEMAHLVHTEYLLAGRTTMDVREVLRRSMYAATVTGSPVENACRIIERYETDGRGYYAAVLALLGRDSTGAPTADAPIVIRTADVDLDGHLRITAGATLVRDSKPAYEVAETHAKAAGILAAFGLVSSPPAMPSGAASTRPASTGEPNVWASLTHDEDVLIALGSRNQRLSRFWLTDQSDAARAAGPELTNLAGRSVLLIDNEDDFITMLRHVLTTLGMVVTVRRWDEVDLAGDRVTSAGFDLVIVGPGPGDPREADDPKIAATESLVRHLLESGQRFLAVCLGHQVLCAELGLPLTYKDIVFQGTQTRITLDGRPENVGFYNTFVARSTGDADLVQGEEAVVQEDAKIHVDADPDSGDVNAVRGPHFAGVQFHAESILTENGYELIRDLVTGLLDD